ncbi:PilZ domain-containing protein [Candidatus Omnitrophota bacterium]
MTEDKADFKPDFIFDRRRFVRVDGTFVVSYKDISTAYPKNDISQTKNISQGGLLFTTDRKFIEGTALKLRLRLPDSHDYIDVKVRVVDSAQKVKNIMYETRARFISITDEGKDSIRKIVERSLREERRIKGDDSEK